MRKTKLKNSIKIQSIFNRILAGQRAQPAAQLTDGSWWRALSTAQAGRPVIWFERREVALLYRFASPPFLFFVIDQLIN